MEITPEECVREVLDVIPMVMRSLRAEFRSHRGNDVSIPQYRTLMFLRRSPGMSLAEVADHLGITPPSASKLVDGLVARGLIDRQESPADRRRIALALTTSGAELAEASFRATQAAYTARFSALPKDTLELIAQAMEALRPIFCLIIGRFQVRRFG
jgi:MarR family transcriptional regulator for hemolysin